METKKDNYIKNPHECPHCKSKNIMSLGNFENDENWVSVEVECHDCGKLWKEIYTLNDVNL